MAMIFQAAFLLFNGPSLVVFLDRRLGMHAPFQEGQSADATEDNGTPQGRGLFHLRLHLAVRGF
jgi:hypothetical protein